VSTESVVWYDLNSKRRSYGRVSAVTHRIMYDGYNPFPIASSSQVGRGGM
jgi:hypothetical protein